MATRSMNKAMLIGNLTRDPQLRYTGKGTPVASFSLATNRSWTPADGGERVEEVEYHNIVAWSKLAEICDQLLGKGDQVFCEGRLQTREWQGDDGQDRRTTEVVIDNMILLTSRSGKAGDDSNYSGGSSSSKKSKSSKSAKSKAAPTDSVGDAEDISDDIPF